MFLVERGRDCFRAEGPRSEVADLLPRSNALSPTAFFDLQLNTGYGNALHRGRMIVKAASFLP